MHTVQFLLTPIEVLISPLIVLGAMLYRSARMTAYVRAYASKK